MPHTVIGPGPNGYREGLSFEDERVVGNIQRRIMASVKQGADEIAGDNLVEAGLCGPNAGAILASIDSLKPPTLLKLYAAVEDEVGGRFDAGELSDSFTTKLVQTVRDRRENHPALPDPRTRLSIHDAYALGEFSKYFERQVAPEIKVSEKFLAECEEGKKEAAQEAFEGLTARVDSIRDVIGCSTREDILTGVKQLRNSSLRYLRDTLDIALQEEIVVVPAQENARTILNDMSDLIRSRMLILE